MAIQTLNTIKNWFKTGLKPSQAQFWDTWDSFRHKFEKVPVKDIDGIDELLLTKADKTILDNHLADKIAHAPQINTDWNSESGFSQLINKPEFKTINGEEIIGEGDITISSAIPTLNQVLNSDNKSLTQPIVFLDEEYSATIDSKNLSIDGPLGEGIQYNGDNINWSKGDKNLKLLFDGESAGQNTFSFPEMPDSSTPYKLATDQVVSATQSGIVDTTFLQELGGADKLINGVRIGRGNNQDISNVVFASGYTNEVSTGLRSSALGFGTLNSNTTGNNNTAVGCNALTANTTGTSNTAVGRNALMSNTTASFNSAFGTQSLMFNTTGTLNMAFGSNALYNNTTGNNNVSAGASSLQTNTTGGYNTSLGAYSLYSSNGISNIAIGNMAGSTISTGNNNIIIGATSNSSLTPGSLTTGSNNLVIGPNQGLTSGITTGNGNVVLGKITGLPSDSENTISLSDGIGNVALRKETDNRLLAPGLTNALIDSGGAKSLVTKEYLDAHSGASQDLQSIMETGSSYQDMDNFRVLGYFGNDIVAGGANGGFNTNGEYTMLSNASSDQTSVSRLLLQRVDGVISDFAIPTNKPAGTYTLATLDDIKPSPQNIANVLDAGNTAYGRNMVFRSHIDPEGKMTLDESQLYFNSTLYNESTFYSNSRLTPYTLTMEKSAERSTLEANKLTFDNFNLGYSIGINPPVTLTGHRNQTLQDKDGEIALLNDITLQKVLDNESIAEIDSKSFHVKSIAGDDYSSIKAFARPDLMSNVQNLTLEGSLAGNKGIMQIYRGNVNLAVENTDTGIGKTLAITAGTQNGFFELQDISGAHYLATTDDINKIYTNASTTALTTSAELNSLYPNAKEGDEVTFLEATPYTLICKKLLSGWVMYQVGKLP